MCFAAAALLATGSQDATILVHSLSAEVKDPLQRHTGHEGLVTTITHQHGQLVSGSWDGYVATVSCLPAPHVVKLHTVMLENFMCNIYCVLSSL